MGGAIASILAIAGLSAVILASLLVSVGPGVSASAKWVTIANFSFTPRDIVINVGDTVTWQNNATFTDHTATSTSAPADGSFDSGIIAPGTTYTHTFTIAGSYTYWCTIHTTLMTGTITVNPAIPEFSSYAFVIVGLMVMMLGLAYARKRS